MTRFPAWTGYLWLAAIALVIIVGLYRLAGGG